ncbi:MAG: sigma-70 family RNA polymerase sigma factor [Bacteroidetes bacterium]|nr:sigma-70 family RNA polymerase sigma factor [Bacteroidota bacterium]
MDAALNTYTQASDFEIVDQVIAGNTALFELLIRRYNTLLYRIARTHGLSHEDAEDIMQDAHFAAFCQLKNFRHEASYKTWLARIALHRCYHKLHSAQRQNELPESDIHQYQTDFMQAAPNTRPDGKTANRQLATVLEENIQALPLIYRNVFMLREVEGFSTAETATLMDISQVNVKVRLNRAKMLLRKQLEAFYTSSEIFEFNLRYCDKVVQGVFDQIAARKPASS